MISDESVDLGDLSPQQKTLREGGRTYVVREASAAAGVKYRLALEKTNKFVDGKYAGSEGQPELEPLLVSLCTFEVDKGGQETPVSLDVVKGWTDRKVRTFFDWADRLSPELKYKPMTVRDVDDRIAELRKHRKRLLELEGGGDPDPNAPAPGTPGSSASPSGSGSTSTS